MEWQPPNEFYEEIHSEEPKQEKSKKEKKGRIGVTMLIIAAMLASFGLGSLFTSYRWIQSKSSSQLQMSNIKPAPQTGQGQSNLSTMGYDLTIAEVSNLTAASVVEITTETVSTDLFMRQYITEGAGSGVIITQDGYIATNNHVIEDASKVTVRLTSGEEYEAKLIGTDEQTDIAVLKINAENLTAVTFGDSDTLVVGDVAIAVGNPLGQLGGTVTNGIISALDREIELENQTMRLLQTNAAINPGNSGGGLFNSQGELIGLVVAKSAGSNVEGLGFAIPSNVVAEVVQSLIDVGYVKGRPVLGVSVVDVNSIQQAYQYGVSHLGVYIMDLTKGSKAEKSGLKVSDLILAIDDTQISSATELKRALGEHQIGDIVKVTVSRESKLLTFDVELTESTPTK